MEPFASTVEESILSQLITGINSLDANANPRDFDAREKPQLLEYASVQSRKERHMEMTARERDGCRGKRGDMRGGVSE